MTDNNNWPGKPGVPLNPDWTGAHHWLSYQGEEPGLYEWDGKYWKMGGGHAPMDYVVDHFTYIAPVLTPAEVDARVKQARRDALREAAQRAEDYATTVWQHGSIPDNPHECAVQVAFEIQTSILAMADEAERDCP